MPAQIARTGVLSGRSKRRRRREAGDSGQEPGEMVTAGAQPALVRLGRDGHCGGWGRRRELPGRGSPVARQRKPKFSGVGWIGEQSWKSQGSCGKQKSRVEPLPRPGY